MLIAVLIMAIGLLGIAALQAAALRNSQSAAERGQAVVQTHTILDSMRANRAAALAGSYNIALTGTAPTASSRITRDQANWITQLKLAMGNSAQGAISCTTALCTITIQWDDSRGSAGSSTEQLVTETRL
ncbi:type IV pilus modification protein PilV [Lysobacter bugurensis]|uniref:Type IV pilus modification protein PilV n=1 Tax=Cognatilysobacter bugurensis TaxID=543356 RepID=A0A918SXV4_9GAMM|nr:type IV pilus modification protein PilV [Lysobacter bugurensis]